MGERLRALKRVLIPKRSDVCFRFVGVKPRLINEPCIVQLEAVYSYSTLYGSYI